MPVSRRLRKSRSVRKRFTQKLGSNLRSAGSRKRQRGGKLSRRRFRRNVRRSVKHSLRSRARRISRGGSKELDNGDILGCINTKDCESEELCTNKSYNFPNGPNLDLKVKPCKKVVLTEKYFQDSDPNATNKERMLNIITNIKYFFKKLLKYSTDELEDDVKTQISNIFKIDENNVDFKKVNETLIFVKQILRQISKKNLDKDPICLPYFEDIGASGDETGFGEEVDETFDTLARQFDCKQDKNEKEILTLFRELALKKEK